MADAQRTIDLIFNGVDKTGAAVQSVLRNTGDLAGGVQAATQPLADFTFAALKFEAALLATGAAITAFAVKTAGDFDSAFREISTLLNEPIEDLEEFRQAILDYASTSTAPLEQVTGAIYNAISAGVDFADSIDVVTQAEKLSIAGRADLNESLLVLVSSLNAYGLGMDQAERFSDLLFQTVRSGQTTLPDLASSLSQVSGIAATTGVDFDELLAAIATLTATGTPTAQAVTQIRGALSSILKPTSDAAKAADELGINFSLQRLEAVGLSGVLDDVQRATGGNTEEMARLFGSVEGLNAVLNLTGLGAEKFAETLVAMDESAGATGAAYEKMADSIGVSTQKVQNALDGLLIAVGDPLLDEFGGVADSIVAIFQALGGSVQSSNGLGPLLEYVEQVAQEIESAFAGIAGNLPQALEGVDASKAIAGLESLKNAVEGLFDGVDLGTPEGLRDAIQKAVDAFGNLSEFSAGAIEGLQPLVRIAEELFDSFSGLDSATARANGETFGFATTVNILSGAVASVLPSLEALVSLYIGGKLGIGLIGALKAATAAAGSAGFAGALVGGGGLLAAAGATGVGVGILANKVTELATGTSLSDRLSDWFTGFTNLDEQAAELTRTIPVARGELEKPATGGLSNSLEEIVVSAQKITPELLVDPLEDIVVTAERVESAFSGQAGAFDSAANSLGGIIPIYDEATGKLVGFTDGINSADSALNASFDGVEKTAGGIKELGKSADEMRELSEAAFLKLEELASNERITNIEARVSLNIAELEADTQRTLAAFDSINTSINSTGELIGSLFGSLSTAGNFREQFAIERQIDEENRRRDEALDLQRELTEAQVEAIRARTDAIERGDAMITVDGAGLQPHLEAFMWEILEAIQVRVNQEGLEVLFP
jgi:TP901 family phage tail tape measure protein